MLKKRIIPCLDIKDGRTVKGINFLDLADAGDPVALAKQYATEGADELVFLDITATIEKRKTLSNLVEQISREINIPFTVGGGINSIQDVSLMINSGADKVSINSAAIANPQLIQEIAKEFGSQCIVLAMDVKFDTEWIVYSKGGRTKTNHTAKHWARTVVDAGAGEILLTSMNNDGTRNGFAVDITNDICNEVNVPVIASGGAGSMQHFKELFEQTPATGALAASIFHFGDVAIPDLKNYLKDNNISTR